MSHNHTWEEAQKEELSFWNTPGAELGEQLKQLTYAKYLGLDFYHDGNSPYVIDKTGKSILDIGGGPVSLLLKTVAKRKVVVDPCLYAGWVTARYNDSGVEFWHVAGEDIVVAKGQFDEVWLYNVLQHTQDPEKIFRNAHDLLAPDGVFRFLDWVDTPTNVAHPVSLSTQDIASMLAKAGFRGKAIQTDTINENGAVGKIAYGIFEK